jgi:hypothetical protein
MTHESENSGAPETVPLQNAVLCVDCELVTSSPSEQCPVCGGHALLALATMIGGRLVDHKETLFHQRQLFLFDLHVTIDIPHMEAAEASATIESISKIVAPRIVRNRASLHVNVEPIASSAQAKLKAA